MSNQAVVVGAKIPPAMKVVIDKFLTHDMHISISDFVGDAIREKIRRDAPQLYSELFQQKEVSEDAK